MSMAYHMTNHVFPPLFQGHVELEQARFIRSRSLWKKLSKVGSRRETLSHCKVY